MRPHALLLIATLTSTLFPSAAARACSICGCDPVTGTLGIDRPAERTLRVLTEARYLSKESGVADDLETEREGRLAVRAQYSPIDRLALQLELPLFLFKDTSHGGGATETARGLGDLSLGARVELLRVGGLIPRHTLALIGSVKLPTGSNDHAHGGEPIEEHGQLGSGSWDGSLGLSYVYGDFPWALYASAQARVNGRNGREFAYGNALFGTLGVRRSFLENKQLVLSLEAQARSAGKDRLGEGGYDGDSGGQVYYATLGATYGLTERLLLRGVLQLPVATALNGVQSERPVGYLAIGYDLSL